MSLRRVETRRPPSLLSVASLCHVRVFLFPSRGGWIKGTSLSYNKGTDFIPTRQLPVRGPKETGPRAPPWAGQQGWVLRVTLP